MCLHMPVCGERERCVHVHVRGGGEMCAHARAWRGRYVRGGGGACMCVAGCVSAIYLASLHCSFLRIIPARHGHSQLPFVIPP